MNWLISWGSREIFLNLCQDLALSKATRSVWMEVSCLLMDPRDPAVVARVEEVCLRMPFICPIKALAWARLVCKEAREPSREPVKALAELKEETKAVDMFPVSWVLAVLRALALVVAALDRLEAKFLTPLWAAVRRLVEVVEKLCKAVFCAVICPCSWVTC